jgi:hypothetical protein
MERKVHPNSLANLGTRPLLFEEKKKTRTVTVTEEGWKAIKQKAKDAGCSSISDFIEKVARGQIEIPRQGIAGN